MSIQHTEAIILKAIPYGETSKIVTALTRSFGKVSFIAKGARDVRSKYGGSLEPFSYVNVIFYERETRDLQYLSDVSVIHPFFRIRDALDLTYTALSVVEICQKAVHGGETSDALFQSLVRTLRAIEEKPKNSLSAFVAFLVYAAEHLGYRLDVSCSACRDMMTHESLGLNIEKGCLVCESCPPERRSLIGAAPLSHEAAAVLVRMARGNENGIQNIALSPKAARELYAAMLKHLQFHVEDLRGLHAIHYMKV